MAYLYEKSYPYLNIRYDEAYQAIWLVLNSEPVPCFSHALLKSLLAFFNDFQTEALPETDKCRFIVGTSGMHGVYNLGGDLKLFSRAILSREKETLMTYAVDCIKALHMMMVHLERELTTINVVCGDALGGGFEGAMSANVLIAEKGTKMGFPEVLFNLFPGMGAYSLLSRKVGMSSAEKMILSGRQYVAEELYEMGIVDILAEKNGGMQAARRYMKDSLQAENTYQAVRKIKDLYHPIPYQELLDITMIWVESALKLTERDLQKMSVLIRRQQAKYAV